MNRTGACTAALLLIAWTLSGQKAVADDVYWQGSGGDGNWSYANNWNPNLVPESNDMAWVTNGGAPQIDGNCSVGGICVDQGSALSLTSGSLNVYSNYGIGLSREGDENFSVIIGCAGQGTFTQTEGTHTINSYLDPGGGYFLVVGYLSGSTGTYILSGGTLNGGSLEYIGDSGDGTFIQTGGTNTISGPGLFLGMFGGSTGRYDLSGGALTVTGAEIVGGSTDGSLSYLGGGDGTFTQTGGTNTVTGFLALSLWPGRTGSYSLAGAASSLTVNGIECVGASGQGTFTQTDGTHTVNGSIALGYSTGATGNYSLGGGTFIVEGNEYVGGGPPVSLYGEEHFGGAGTGTFAQTGGTHTISGTLTIAGNDGSTGLYTLQDGNLIVPQINIGAGGTLGLGLGGLASPDSDHPAVDLYNDGRVNVGDSNGMPVTFCFGDIAGDGNIVIGYGATLWVKSIGGNDVWVSEGGILIFSWENPALYSATAMANYELAVPEPATFMLVATVGAGLLIRKRRADSSLKRDNEE